MLANVLNKKLENEKVFAEFLVQLLVERLGILFGQFVRLYGLTVDLIVVAVLFHLGAVNLLPTMSGTSTSRATSF